MSPRNHRCDLLVDMTELASMVSFPVNQGSRGLTHEPAVMPRVGRSSAEAVKGHAQL
jgi:hypothetical protein